MFLSYTMYFLHFYFGGFLTFLIFTLKISTFDFYRVRHFNMFIIGMQFDISQKNECIFSPRGYITRHGTYHEIICDYTVMALNIPLRYSIFNLHFQYHIRKRGTSRGLMSGCTQILSSRESCFVTVNVVVECGLECSSIQVGMSSSVPPTICTIFRIFIPCFAKVMEVTYMNYC